MTLDETVAALGRTTLFGSLTRSELQLLAHHAMVRRLARGDILFVVEEEAQGLFVIVSGSVRAFRVSSEGREQVIHVEHAGATLAEVPVFDDGAYPATASAEEDSVVLFIDKRDFRQFLLAYPQIAVAALKLLAGRLRRHAELVESLSLREVGQRLAQLFLSEAEASGSSNSGRMEVTLPLSHQQLAARVGSVREVVTRALTRLQKDGLISLDGRQLVIFDHDRLASYVRTAAS
jgi:CRP/FNR family transcriptional regulator